MDSEEQNQAPISKSQRKREAQALTLLGRKLMDLKPAQLATVPLSDRLREAIVDARAITRRIARKREMQYVGKLLREVDPEPIEAALRALEQPGDAERLRQHRLERWRDALVLGGDPALHALLEARPDADRSALRPLLLKARREAAVEGPPAAARQLFRALRALDDRSPLPEEAPVS